MKHCVRYVVPPLVAVMAALAAGGTVYSQDAASPAPDRPASRKAPLDIRDAARGKAPAARKGAEARKAPVPGKTAEARTPSAAKAMTNQEKGAARRAARRSPALPSETMAQEVAAPVSGDASKQPAKAPDPTRPRGEGQTGKKAPGKQEKAIEPVEPKTPREPSIAQPGVSEPSLPKSPRVPGAGERALPGRDSKPADAGKAAPEEKRAPRGMDIRQRILETDDEQTAREKAEERQAEEKGRGAQVAAGSPVHSYYLFGDEDVRRSARHWLKTLDEKRIRYWCRSNGMGLASDAPPVANRMAAFVSKNGSTIEVKGLARFKRYSAWIDFVRYLSVDRSPVSARLEIYADRRLVGAFRLGDITYRNNPYRLELPYDLTLDGNIVLEFREYSHSGGFWGVWDVVVTDGPDLPASIEVPAVSESAESKMKISERIVDERKPARRRPPARVRPPAQPEAKTLPADESKSVEEKGKPAEKLTLPADRAQPVEKLLRREKKAQPAGKERPAERKGRPADRTQPAGKQQQGGEKAQPANTSQGVGK